MNQFVLLVFGGKGSSNPRERGLHLKILQVLSRTAWKNPYSRNACMVYSEQVGVKRHAGGNRGEIIFL
ncbi:hypothetical protein AYB33_05075 [Leptospira santarosai]|nr:hypothetical protein AYB33_05075 [Leptospira santarosai]